MRPYRVLFVRLSLAFSISIRDRLLRTVSSSFFIFAFYASNAWYYSDSTIFLLVRLLCCLSLGREDKGGFFGVCAGFDSY